MIDVINNFINLQYYESLHIIKDEKLYIIYILKEVEYHQYKENQIVHRLIFNFLNKLFL